MITNELMLDTTRLNHTNNVYQKKPETKDYHTIQFHLYSVQIQAKLI